ncbi:MAG TPA: GFA family protein [Myxococcota bacterium]|nr:GFA family protein [Myxococcota bacterium]
MAATTHRGACFCGAVKLEVTGSPVAMGFCHCASCRGWLAAPVHGFTLWPAANAKVIEGVEQLGVFKKTERSHRQFCRRCGGHVFVGHPAVSMIDVMSAVLPSLPFQPTMHVHYGEKVLAMRDGLVKFKDFPKNFGGSGDTLPE